MRWHAARPHLPPSSATIWLQINCNDKNKCTEDSCDPATGCVYTPVSPKEIQLRPTGCPPQGIDMLMNSAFGGLCLCWQVDEDFPPLFTHLLPGCPALTTEPVRWSWVPRCGEVSGVDSRPAERLAAVNALGFLTCSCSFPAPPPCR